MDKNIVDHRAKFAYDYVSNLHDSNELKNFQSHVKKLPAMILNNGLGNAIAFAYSKKWKNVLTALQKWLKDKHCSLYDVNGAKKFNNDKNYLIERILNSSTDEYRALTEEMLAYLNWLRRFADAFGEDNPTKDQKVE